MYTPMIVSDSFVKSVKARDSEFTTNSGNFSKFLVFHHPFQMEVHSIIFRSSVIIEMSCS